MAKGGAIRAGRAYVELYADNNPLVRGLKMAERRMRAFGNKMKALGSQMTMAGLVGTAPAAISVKWFMEFDDAMRTVQARTQATAAEFESMTEKARALGRATSYTAAEVANAMVILGTMGLSPTEIEASIDSVLSLARATGTDMAMAADIAGNALRAFELEASSFGMVADVLVATANTSAQTLEDMGESFKYVSPIARNAGMSLQDTAKVIGTLANLGIKGSMAGTSLRQMLLRMATDSKKIEDLGVAVADPLTGQMRSPADVLVDIGKAMANMPNMAQMATMKDIFDQRAVTAGLILTSKQFDRLNEAIDNASGVAKRTSDMMDAGIGGAFRRLLSATQDVALSIGDALAPALMRLADYLTGAANKISGFVAGNENLILTVSGVSAGLLMLGPIVSGLGTLMIAGAAGVGALATAIGLIATPVSGAVLLLASLGREGSLTGRAVAEAGDTITSHFAALKSTVDEVFGAMTDAIAAGDMQLAMKSMVAGVKVELLRLQDIWQSFWENLPGMGGDDKAWIERLNAITAAENELSKLKQQAAKKADAQAMLDRVAAGKDLAKSLTDRIAEAWQTASERAAKQEANRNAGIGAKPGMPNWLARTAAQFLPVDQMLAIGAKVGAGVSTPAAPAGQVPALPGWVTSTASKLAGMDPGKILQGVGRFIGEASSAVPEFVANTAMNLTDDIAPEAGMVSQIQRSARGTFSSLAAGRMGAVGSSTNRTERQLEKLVTSQQHANRRLDQFVDLATKAKLVFTGALPG